MNKVLSFAITKRELEGIGQARKMPHSHSHTETKELVSETETRRVLPEPGKCVGGRDAGKMLNGNRSTTGQEGIASECSVAP